MGALVTYTYMKEGEKVNYDMVKFASNLRLLISDLTRNGNDMKLVSEADFKRLIILAMHLKMGKEADNENLKAQLKRLNINETAGNVIFSLSHDLENPSYPSSFSPTRFVSNFICYNNESIDRVNGSNSKSNIEFIEAVSNGNLEEAKKILDKEAFWKEYVAGANQFSKVLP